MINIGSRRECFFDNYLIDEEKTTAEKRLHKPVRKQVLHTFDQPFENSLTTFVTVIFAEGKYRMYYVTSKNYICYGESDDAQHWTFPKMGIVSMNGSTENNVILTLDMLKEKFDFHFFDNMSVFYDENPACPADEKYKMTCWWLGHAALILLLSEDGIHFDKMRMITTEGEFDSQNRSFWSAAHGKYFAYFRSEHVPAPGTDRMDTSCMDADARALYDEDQFLLREPGEGTYVFMRDICVAESPDAINWSHTKHIQFTGRDFQMYNNCVFPYPRAPHMLIAFPLRYAERKAWTKNYDELCGREDRLERMKTIARFGLAISDGLFMSSRDGYNFVKFDEAFIAPPPENPESFVYGDGTAVPNVIEVPSDIPGADNEYMILVRESYRTAVDHNKLVKYTIRMDGFVSIHAGSEPAVAVTKPFIYEGKDLYANIATSARGGAFFTLTCGDESYTSVEIFGNSVDKRIRFADDEAVGRLSGKEVTLTVQMFDCDLYAIRFQ